jgi:hypothetical protein
MLKVEDCPKQIVDVPVIKEVVMDESLMTVVFKAHAPGQLFPPVDTK